MSPRLKKEIVLALALLAFGLVGLPAAIYIVGIELIGPYEGTTGAVGLGFDIWSALAGFRWTAWLLVLSPYLVVQFARLAIRILLRAQPAVNTVTD
jgi:hypothetical protein